MKNFFKKTSCYTTLPNTFAQDDRLSIEARGLGLLIFSLPDDWVFQQTWFYEKAGGNRNRRKTVVKALNELIHHDYLCRLQDRKKGKFDGAVWFFDPEQNARAELEAIFTVGTHGTNGTVGTHSAGADSAGPQSTTTKEIETKEEIKKEVFSSSSSPPISEEDEKELMDCEIVTTLDPYSELPENIEELSRQTIIDGINAIATERGGDFENYRDSLIREVLSGGKRTLTNIRARLTRMNLAHQKPWVIANRIKREQGEKLSAALRTSGHNNIFDFLEDTYERANENV